MLWVEVGAWREQQEEVRREAALAEKEDDENEETDDEEKRPRLWTTSTCESVHLQRG